MDKVKMFNPFTNKMTTIKAYGNVAKKIYKYMITHEGAGVEILPKHLGLNMKSLRFFRIAVDSIDGDYEYHPETQIKTYRKSYYTSVAPVKDLFEHLSKVVYNNPNTEYLLKIKHSYIFAEYLNEKKVMVGVSYAEQGMNQFGWATLKFDFDEFDGITYEEFLVIIRVKLPSPTSSSNVKILQSKTNVLPTAKGGCSSKHPKIFKIQDCKFTSPCSSNNNCFFACVKDELGIVGKGTGFKTECNRIRLIHDIIPNEMITIKQAQEILNDKGITLCVYNECFNILEGDIDAHINLILIDNHYSKFNVKKDKIVCQKCGTPYIHSHSEETCKQRVQFLKMRNSMKHSICHTDKTKKFQKNCYNKNDEVLHYDIESHKRQINGHTIPYFEQMPFIVGFVFKQRYGYFSGRDCMKKFYKFIISHNDEIKYINAYNGSNYDHYFLWREHMKTSSNIKQNDILVNSGSIISATINKMKLIDLNKHLTGSLRQNLETCGCQISKGEIDYDKFKSWSSMDRDLKNDTKEYLKADVLGLQELYEKANNNIFNNHRRNICDYLTLSSMSFDIWRNLIPEEKVFYPKFEEEKFFRKSIYGGRCYKNAHKFTSKQYEYIKKESEEICKIESREDREIKFGFLYASIDDYVFDADVVSLYPTAMAKNLYPVGKPIGIKGYKKGKLGIYKCSYEAPKNIVYPYLPRRDTMKGTQKLSWDLKDGEECYYTSVDIENAKKLGYRFNICGGYYWEETADLFSEYVEKFISEKNRLKAEGKKGGCEYLTTKLFMNALYGKMLQKPIFDKQFYISNYDELMVKMGEFEITEIEQVGKRWLCKGISKNPHQKEMDIKKPTHLGSFILSYSRTIMMDYTLQTNPNQEVLKQFYYTDTDALHIHSSLLKNLTLSTELGGLDDDVGGKIIRAVWVAPKLYGYEYITPKGDIKYHIRGKGIQLGNRRNDNMCFQDLVDMSNGAEKTFYQDIKFKKINSKLTTNEKENKLDNFTITVEEDTKKVINRTKWSGRRPFQIINKDKTINNNFLVPWGYYKDTLIL